MFSQGDPVLAGVDLDSGYLFALCLKISRSGQDWAEVLEDCKKQGLDLKVVVKDAALGIKSGVEQAFGNCEQRDDCFHAKYIMGKVFFFLECKAYGAISKEEEARKALESWYSTGYGEPEELLKTFKKAQRRCEKILELHDQYEQAMKRVNEALNRIDLSTGRCKQRHRRFQFFFTSLSLCSKRSYNQKKRKSGSFKGQSPYEALTGQTVNDWLTLLGYSLSSSLN